MKQAPGYKHKNMIFRLGQCPFNTDSGDRNAGSEKFKMAVCWKFKSENR